MKKTTFGTAEQEEGFFLISLTRWKTALGRKIEKAKDACNQILVKSLAFYIIRRHQIKDKFSDSCLVFWGQDIALSSGEILITKLLVKE
ncbi:unnamed protein product [Lactuca virosa]|uniref:Uncharacterized protein n=1 Tax=Lactuca virosa TaxID=75947 RepID=A0AAU9MHS5_9ASTR|nr:unnamed protein product [Lactuca virosa]